MTEPTQPSSPPVWLQVDPAALILVVAVLVVPGASRTRVLGTHDGRLRVSVAAPPERGRANDELVDLLARLAGVPRRSVTVGRGATGRRKEVRIDADDPTALAAAVRRLAAAAGPG